MFDILGFSTRMNFIQHCFAHCIAICLCGNQNKVSIKCYHADSVALQDCIKTVLSDHTQCSEAGEVAKYL